MKISCDISGLKKQLEEVAKKVETNSRRMVSHVAMTAVLRAVENTPIGDHIAYYGLYRKRLDDPNSQSYGLQPYRGFARGSWRLSVDGTIEFQEFYGISGGGKAISAAQSNVKDYELGDEILISNLGPYIRNLEQNTSPQTDGQGIIAPTLEDLMSIQSTDLGRFLFQANGRGY